MQPLPNGITLFKQSWALYKARVNDFLPLALVPALVSLLSFGLDTPHMSPLIAVSFALACVLAVIASIWASLAFRYLLVSESQPVTLAQALRKAGGKFLPFVWVSILAGFVVSAAMVLVAGIPAVLLFAALYFTHALGSAPSLAAATVLGGLLAIAVAIRFGFLFMFSTWSFADTDVRGFAALRQSRELVTGNIRALFNSLFVVFLFCILISVATGVVVGLIGAFIPGSHDLMQTIGNAISQVIVTPITIGATYYLYQALKARRAEAGSTRSTNGSD